MPVKMCWNFSRFMDVLPTENCHECSLPCNILGIKFIILWPQIHSLTFLSALSYKVSVLTFQLKQSSKKESSNTTSIKEQEQGDEGREAEGARVTGSYSTELGCSHPYLYDQFNIRTTEQKINQIILLQVWTLKQQYHVMLKKRRWCQRF